jgi:MATE family multidrug resistance protein
MAEDAASERSHLLEPASATSSTWTEMRILAGLSLPLFFQNYLRFFVGVSGVYSVAQLGTRELAASNLGLLTINAFGVSLLIGLIGGSLNALANQAATSRNPEMASIYCIRTFLVSMQLMPMLFLFLWNINSVFRFLLPKADPEMLKLASDYSKISSLALPPLALSECIRRYCQAFGKVMGPALGYAFAAPFAVGLNWALVHGP